jgi:hypothetical protein
VLGVLLTLCAAGRGDARVNHGHQSPARPVDPAMLVRPSGSGAKPPRPTSRVRRRDDPSGYRGSGPPVNWANVRLPAGGSAAKPPPPQVVRVEHTETKD